MLMKTKYVLLSRSLLALAFAACVSTPAVAQNWAFPDARNPVLSSDGNLRDPAILRTNEGCFIYYSRYFGKWGNKDAWSLGMTFTKDFVHFEPEKEITPKGFASPDGPVYWKGRWVMAYCSYPVQPSRLHFSTSPDGRNWSAPQSFLDEIGKLPWNTQHRAIDPTLVIDGDVLHCFFIASGHNPLKNRGGNLLGHAITRDPELKKWEILTPETPLIGFSERAPDGVENLTIFKNGPEWLMILSEGLAKQHIALASSKDLEHWNLEGPISVARQKWIGTKFGAPFVWREGSHWMMILMGDAARRTTLGLLQSEDGRKWEIMPEK